MSAPGFGFSAGDFISAVKLIIDITNALKDTGGAAENYRQVLTELNLLKDILSELQKGQHGPVAEQSNNPFVKHAKTQAKLTLATLANFLALISKFDASLGHQRSTSWYRGIGRKGQWALVYAKQVDDLRLRIGTQLQALLLLSQLQESQPTKIHKQLCEIKDQNKELIGRLPERPISTIDDLRSQMELVKIQNDAVLRACLSQGPGLHRADASRLVMQGPYPHGSEEAGPSNQFVSQNTQSQIVEDQSSSPSPLAAVPLSSRDSDAMKNRDATSYQGITSSLTHLNTQSDVDTVSTLLMKLICAIARNLGDLFTRVCFAFPQLMRQYHRLCSNISITPMLLVAENINFEDVLGRKATLHYEFFRHWPNLNRFLLRQFEDCPGEDYVARGQYFFLDSHTTNEKVSSDSELAWHKLVAPGCEISMSMKVTMNDELKKDPNTKCPDPRCTGRSAGITNKRIFSCQTCHLTYSLMPSELEGAWTGDESQDMSEILDIIPYRRRLVAPSPSLITLGVNVQIASFKRIHLITPRASHSVVESSPRPPVGHGHRWICCNCGQGWFNVHTDLLCPTCQLQRCKICKYG